MSGYDDSGDTQIAGISVGGLGRGNCCCCCYLIMNISEVNKPMLRYFLGEHAVGNPNQSWSKGTANWSEERIVAILWLFYLLQ